MLRGDISEILFSSIKENDSHRASKLLQIERWCYANWRLHAGYGEIRNKFLAQVLSDGECWEEVGGLHEVKLNRQKVGEKLIVLGSDSTPNPFGTARYKIACQCCLEQDIVKMFSDHMQERNVINEDSLKKLVSNLSHGDPLQAFWSHVVGNYALSNNFDCTVDWKQVEAVEFFWGKVKALPESEMSKEKKDEILMKNAVYSARGNFSICSDIFEFFFDQFEHSFEEKEPKEKYSDLLKRDLEKNGCYCSLNRMKEMLSFDKYQKLFDYLKPDDISGDYYNTCLDSIEIQNYSGHYLDAAEKLFMYIWKKEGFDIYHTFVINKEVMVSSSYIHKKLLVRWVEKDCMEPVWAVLDKLDPDQRKKYMTYKQAEHIRGILATCGDSDKLEKFLAYDKSADKEPYRKDIPGPSGDLTEAKVQETRGQSRIE